jgi:hypothetical protein
MEYNKVRPHQMYKALSLQVSLQAFNMTKKGFEGYFAALVL